MTPEHRLFGIPVRVIDTDLCKRVVPIKRHTHRRNQSAAYHRRIQKKWAKRYGTKVENVAYFVSPAAAGLFGMPDFLAMSPRSFGLLSGFAQP